MMTMTGSHVPQQKEHLRPGYDADILAVDGDPLSDPAALHAIRAVYVRGTALTR
jgi:imidazolonepropionase-like amidohydrolase